MNEVNRLLQMPQLARRLGLFYSIIYKAFVSGELQADYALLNGSPLFEEDKVELALQQLRKRLSAEDFDETLHALRQRERILQGKETTIVDERRDLSAQAPREPSTFSRGIG